MARPPIQSCIAACDACAAACDRCAAACLREEQDLKMMVHALRSMSLRIVAMAMFSHQTF